MAGVARAQHPPPARATRGRRFLGARGQESAPLELLVSVVVMLLVLAIGMQAMAVVRQEQCRAEVSNALKDFKIHLETAVSSHTPARFVFELPSGCWEKPRVRMRVVADDLACSAFCGGARRDCVLLNFLAEGYGETVCVNIPPITSFPDHDSTYDPEAGAVTGRCVARHLPSSKAPVKMIPVNFYTSGVCPGRYELVDRTPVAGSAFPVVCAYKACVDQDEDGGFCQADIDCALDCWACQ